MNNYNDSIKNIKQICETSNELKSIEDLNNYIELPCLEACKDFYLKNIITLQSNGNYAGNNSEAWITLDTSTMDKTNLDICHNLVKTNNGILNINQRNVKVFVDEDNIMQICFPLYENDTIGLVSNIFLCISSLFKKQDLLGNRTCFESIVLDYYWSNYSDSDFSTNLKSKMDQYNIWRVEQYDCPVESLCYNYSDAIKYYSDLDPVNGAKFVNELIDLINSDQEAYGACDKDDGIIFKYKSDLYRHLSWVQENKNETPTI